MVLRSCIPRAVLCWGLALATGGAVVGCDDGSTAGVGTLLEGQTVRVEDGAGYGPVTVALLDPQRLLVQAVTASDADGNFRFAGVPAGRYVPVAFDEARLLYHNARATVEVPAWRAVRVVLPMIATTGRTGLEVRGRVVDAMTGRPIAGALADLGSLGPRAFSGRSEFSELDGWTSTLNQVTDAQGSFRLAPVYFLVGPDGSPHTPELLVTAAGYHSFSRKGFVDEAELADTLVVALRRGDDGGIVTGRLVGLDGVPVAGLRVGLEWTRVALGPGKSGDASPMPAPNVIVQEAVGISGADGRFRIDGAPVGFSLVLAAYPRDDGWVGQFGPHADLSAADSTDAGDIIVVPTLVTTFPADLDTVAATEVAFSWIPVTGAEHYRVTLQKPDGVIAVSLGDPTPAIDPPDSVFAQPGLYLWRVQAFAAIGEISRTERALSFVVSNPAAAATSPAPSAWSR